MIRSMQSIQSRTPIIIHHRHLSYILKLCFAQPCMNHSPMMKSFMSACLLLWLPKKNGKKKCSLYPCAMTMNYFGDTVSSFSFSFCKGYKIKIL